MRRSKSLRREDNSDESINGESAETRGRNGFPKFKPNEGSVGSRLVMNDNKETELEERINLLLEKNRQELINCVSQEMAKNGKTEMAAEIISLVCF